jgi:hypothetical protein
MPKDKFKPERAMLLLQLESLHMRFHRSKQRGNRGEQTFAALQAVDHCFTLSTVINPRFPADENEQEYFLVPVPLWALQHIVKSYHSYIDAGSSRTIGEVMGLEGGGQGRRSTKAKILTRYGELRLARMVHDERVELLKAGKEKEATLDNVFAEVSVATNYGIDSVRSAWKKWHRIVERQAALGVKTSRSDYPLTRY